MAAVAVGANKGRQHEGAAAENGGGGVQGEAQQLEMERQLKASLFPMSYVVSLCVCVSV